MKNRRSKLRDIRVAGEDYKWLAESAPANRGTILKIWKDRKLKYQKELPIIPVTPKIVADKIKKLED